MLTVSFCAKDLNVSERRVRQFIEEGRLKAERYGAVWLIDEKEFKKFKSKKRLAGQPGHGV